MMMNIYQLAFLVVMLAWSVTSKGYGPNIGDVSGSIGGMGGGVGGYTGGAAAGGVSGRVPVGGIGSYGGGAGGRVSLGGLGSSTGIGGFTGDQAGGRAAGSVGGSTIYGGSGSYGRGLGGNIGGMGVVRAQQPSGAAGFDMSPKPYQTSYQTTDEQGNTQFREESGDGSGTVQGNYGYLDSQGLYRQVEYIANQNGFKANIKTNEPGIGKDSPADVNLIVEQTPAGIQEQYNPAIGVSGGPGGVGRPATGGYQRGIGSGVPGSSTSGGYPGAAGGVASSGIQGGLTSRATPGSLGGSSGLFSGIKKSSSGKSIY